jgi:hypothetical protein
LLVLLFAALGLLFLRAAGVVCSSDTRPRRAGGRHCWRWLSGCVAGAAAWLRARARVACFGVAARGADNGCLAAASRRAEGTGGRRHRRAPRAFAPLLLPLLRRVFEVAGRACAATGCGVDRAIGAGRPPSRLTDRGGCVWLCCGRCEGQEVLCGHRGLRGSTSACSGAAVS